MHSQGRIFIRFDAKGNKREIVEMLPPLPETPIYLDGEPKVPPPAFYLLRPEGEHVKHQADDSFKHRETGEVFTVAPPEPLSD